MKNIGGPFLKSYFVPILVLITIIALIPLALGPIVVNLKIKNEQYQEKRGQLSQLNKKIEDLEEIDADKENFELQEAEKAVPSRKELAPLVIGVGNLAGKNNLLVSEMKLTPGKVATDSAAAAEKSTKPTEVATDKEKKDELSFKVALVGSLENLKKFLADLEEAKQLLGISSIQGKLQTDGSFRFELGVSAPFKGIVSGGDAIAKPVPKLSDSLENTLKQILKFTSYTNVSVPSVPTGVDNPFQ